MGNKSRSCMMYGHNRYNWFSDNRGNYSFNGWSRVVNHMPALQRRGHRSWTSSTKIENLLTNAPSARLDELPLEPHELLQQGHEPPQRVQQEPRAQHGQREPLE